MREDGLSPNKCKLCSDYEGIIPSDSDWDGPLLPCPSNSYFQQTIPDRSMPGSKKSAPVCSQVLGHSDIPQAGSSWGNGSHESSHKMRFLVVSSPSNKDVLDKDSGNLKVPERTELVIPVLQAKIRTSLLILTNSNANFFIVVPVIPSSYYKGHMDKIKGVGGGGGGRWLQLGWGGGMGRKGIQL